MVQAARSLCYTPTDARRCRRTASSASIARSATLSRSLAPSARPPSLRFIERIILPPAAASRCANLRVRRRDGRLQAQSAACRLERRQFRSAHSRLAHGAKQIQRAKFSSDFAAPRHLQPSGRESKRAGRRAVDRVLHGAEAAICARLQAATFQCALAQAADATFVLLLYETLDEAEAAASGAFVGVTHAGGVVELPVGALASRSNVGQAGRWLLQLDTPPLGSIAACPAGRRGAPFCEQGARGAKERRF